MIESLQSRRVGPVVLMIALGKLVNQAAGVELTTVTTERGWLVLRGQSRPVGAVSNFVALVKRAPNFSDVELRQVHQSSAQTPPTYKFELGCAFSRPGAAGSASGPVAPATGAPPARRQINQPKKESDTSEAPRLHQTEYLNRIAQMRKMIETLRLIVPDEQETDQFKRMVYEEGTRAGVNIRAFVAQPLVPHDSYVEMSFKVELDGPYSLLIIFFDRLARVMRMVSVSNLSLGPPASHASADLSIRTNRPVGATCLVTTYFWKGQR